MNINKILEDYLDMRRGLGFKLHCEGKMLLSFIGFLDQHSKNFITTELALAWATLPTKVQPVQWARRLSIVREFARYCTLIDSKSEVPATDLLPISYQRRTPYIFTDNDICKLLQASAQLSIKNPFFSKTLHCLFGLLSVTGLRIREALNLTMDDIDLDAEILTVRHAKFGKSRLIPVHDTTIKILTDYRKQRDKFMQGKACLYWFVDKKHNHLGYYCVKYNFDKLILTIKLNNQTQNCKPNLHTFRHYFAISVLKNWYRNGEDVQRKLPILSTYLGHVETRDTFWYLSACPELMNEANKRLEKHWEKQL